MSKAPKSNAEAAAARTEAPEKPGEVTTAGETSTGDAVISSTQGVDAAARAPGDPALGSNVGGAPVNSFGADAPGGGAPEVAASGVRPAAEFASMAEPIRLERTAGDPLLRDAARSGSALLGVAPLPAGSNDGDALARVSLPGSRLDASSRPRQVEVIERTAAFDPIAAELADAGLVATKAKSNLLIDNLAVAAGAEVAIDPRTYRELREIEAVEAVPGRI